MNWILERLKEPSTYAGIFAIASSVAGVNIHADVANAIMGAGVGVSGLALVLLKEKI